MYKVIYKFRDVKDGLHQYQVGDVYPREGYTPTKARISELASNFNKLGKKLIEEVKEEKPSKVEEVKEETKEELKAEKKPRGKKKKAKE